MTQEVKQNNQQRNTMYITQEINENSIKRLAYVTSSRKICNREIPKTLELFWYLIKKINEDNSLTFLSGHLNGLEHNAQNSDANVGINFLSTYTNKIEMYFLKQKEPYKISSRVKNIKGRKKFKQLSLDEDLLKWSAIEANIEMVSIKRTNLEDKLEEYIIKKIA